MPPGGAASADGTATFQDQDLAPVLFHRPRKAQAGNAGADHRYVNFSGLHVLLIRLNSPIKSSGRPCVPETCQIPFNNVDWIIHFG
jgi:hypothetical protein